MSVHPMEPSPPPPPGLPDEPAVQPPVPRFDDGGWTPPSAPVPELAPTSGPPPPPPTPAAGPVAWGLTPPGAGGFPGPPAYAAGTYPAYGYPGHAGAPPAPAPDRIAWMGFGDEQPRWGMPDILIGMLCWLLLQILVVLPVLAVTEDKTVLSIVGLAGGWAGMIGFLVLISRRKGLKSLRRDFGWDFKWVDPLIGFGVGFVTIIVSGIVRVVVANAFSEPAGSNAEEIFGGAENNHAALLVLALMAGIGAPIVEELFFRGLALRAIERRFGAVVGIIGSSLVFSLLHWQPGTFGSTVSLVSGILVYGLIFALVTRFFKRLGPATFAHMTINTLASAFLLYTVFSGNPITG